jgi:hypothetical protein
LDQQQNNIWINQIAVSPDLVIFVKPLTYKHMTQINLKSFETNRILNVVNDESVSDEKKLEIFGSSFANLTKISVSLVSDSVYKVVASGTEVSDPKFINEFINNVDKEVFEIINNHLKSLKEHNDLKPLEFNTSEEQQANGAPVTYTVPINFNDSDFFG